MGTRSTISIIEKDQTLVKLYTQYDGYWEGVGRDLESIIHEGKLVNGIPAGDQKLGEYFNGAGCLAATIIAKLKIKSGNVYIIDTNSPNDEANHYDVYVKDDDILLYHNEEPKLWTGF